MRIDRGRPVQACIWSYTAGVTARRLFSAAVGVSALVVATAATPDASAQTASQQRAEAAHQVSQAAHAAADAADQVAAGDLPDSAQQSAPSPLAHARQGVVVLERHGKPLGVGTVLAGDGRILTALSPLTHGNNVDARYADGSVSRVKVGHADRSWDLALLIPQNGRWKKGLKASNESPTQAGLSLRSFSLVGKKSLALARTIVKGESTMLGADSELLPDALELATHFKKADLGSPIIDNKGRVVALIARACAPVPHAPCARVPYGVPVSALKAFLRTVPKNAVPPAPWLGIQGVTDDAGPVHGVRVVGVHPQSPAAAAGLHGNGDANLADEVVAVDGKPVATPEALADRINAKAVGDSVELLVFGHGKFRRVTVTLRAAPDASVKRHLAPRHKAHRRAPRQRPDTGY